MSHTGQRGRSWAPGASCHCTFSSSMPSAGTLSNLAGDPPLPRTWRRCGGPADPGPVIPPIALPRPVLRARFTASPDIVSTTVKCSCSSISPSRSGFSWLWATAKWVSYGAHLLVLREREQDRAGAVPVAALAAERAQPAGRGVRLGPRRGLVGHARAHLRLGLSVPPARHERARHGVHGRAQRRIDRESLVEAGELEYLKHGRR